MHKTFSYRNIQVFGINPLTGEACSLAQRILCDLNEQGVDLLSDYWGIKRNSFHENYNSQVEGLPAVASCMIDRHAFFHIIKFACSIQGHPWIILDDVEGTVTVTDEDSIVTGYQELNTLNKNSRFHIIRNSRMGKESVGSRNIHQMSGRVV